MKALPLNEIPPTPLYEKGAFHDTMSRTKKSSSPFLKGGSRGILLNVQLAIAHFSRLIARAKLNDTTSQAAGFWK
jgi:hypothetical protein